MLSKITSCKASLYLKVGAPIIVTMNCQDGICNGTRGVVSGFDPNNNYVNISTGGSNVTIKKAIFSRKYHNNYCTREQFPLLLAWGLTIHRSQGQTLASVTIDATGVNQCNQLGVALSRVKSKGDVAIIGLDLNSLKPADAELVNFIDSGNIPVEV